MENTENTKETSATTTITVDLTAEQYAFLTNWQKTHEQELGIEVPISAMVRKAVDGTMKAQRAREDRPARPSSGPDRRPSDRGGFKSGPRKPFGDREDRGDRRPSDRGGFSSGPRKSFGPRAGGPKFDMLGTKSKTRTFDK